jgi:hypothetical protein
MYKGTISLNTALRTILAPVKVYSNRHCEERSNRELYRADLPIGDCFVPRNDDLLFNKKKATHLGSFSQSKLMY